MPLPQTGCSTSRRPAKFQNTTQFYNFHMLLWWKLCCRFPPKRVCVKISSSYIEKGILCNSRILPSHLHFFLFAFKNATQYLIVLLISHNIDKIHTKYQNRNAAITLFYESELFCQHTFISSARLIHKSKASRTLQVILTVRIWRSQFTKDLTSWNKLNGQ